MQYLSQRCWVTESFIFQEGHLLDSIRYSPCTSDYFGQHASSVLLYTHCEDPSIPLRVYQLPTDLSACYCWYDISSVPLSFALDIIHCCSLPAKVVSARKISMQQTPVNHWLCVWYSQRVLGFFGQTVFDFFLENGPFYITKKKNNAKWTVIKCSTIKLERNQGCLCFCADMHTKN